MTRIQRCKGVTYLDTVGSVHQRRSHSALAHAAERTAHVQIDEINLALRHVSANTCVSTARHGNTAGHNTHLVVDELTRAGTGIRVRRSKLNAEDIFTRVPLEQRAFHRVAV